VTADSPPDLRRRERTTAALAVGARTAVVASAPTRLDFGGGWTDVPPWSDREGGIVCNVAIGRRATVRATVRGSAASDDEPGDDARVPLLAAARRRVPVAGHAPVLRLSSDFPAGAGLGGSSAAGVAALAALHAWHGEEVDAAGLAEESRALEIEELGIPGGRQDHYAAAFGGALELHFGARTEVRRIPLGAGTREALDRRCIVAYTGESRISGRTITAVLGAYEAGDARVIAALERMRALAAEMAEALRRGDVDALGAMVGEHWRHQRTLDPAIPTPAIDAIVAAAGRAGALGAKALGASGGGCVLAIARDGGEEALRAALAPLGPLLDVTIDEEGVRLAGEPA
jgi:D-glycero-alpha-D-manno-heptose-7-phosphate kinase